MNFGQVKDLVVETFSEWSEDRAERLAAALSYYTIFSLAPLLVIAVAIAGAFFGQSSDQAQQAVLNQVAVVVGQDTADAMAELLQSANRPELGSIAGILGVVTLLMGAAGLFGQLQDALNTIWEVAPKPNRGIWGMIRSRFFSFSMVLGTGFLLLVSLVLSSFLSALGGYVVGDSFEQAIFWRIVNFVVSLLATWGLFTLIFKVIPDVKIAWSDVALGAAITAVLFSIGRFLLSLYLANASPANAFGAAGSLVLLLIWVYYSAQILFLGAEFTQVYARRYGSRIQPDDNAVPLTDAAQANQGMPSKEQLQAASSGRASSAAAASRHPGEPEKKPANSSNAQRPAGRAAPARPSQESAGAVAGETSRAGLAGLALLSGIFSFFSSRRRKR